MGREIVHTLRSVPERCTTRNSEHTHTRIHPKKVIQTSRAVDCKHIQSIRAFFSVQRLFVFLVTADYISATPRHITKQRPWVSTPVSSNSPSSHTISPRTHSTSTIFSQKHLHPHRLLSLLSLLSLLGHKITAKIRNQLELGDWRTEKGEEVWLHLQKMM